jgi:hypothetical protein
MNTRTPLFLVSILLVSCNNYKQQNNSGLKPDGNEPDTLRPTISSSHKTNTYPTIFEAAFTADTKVLQGDYGYNFHTLNIGVIKIHSGKIIACDPIVMQDAVPFARVFPKGEFPVHLAMAKTDNDERVAFSRIVFSDKPVSKWEFALEKGQAPISLGDTSFYCYGVDAGTGIFIDSVSNAYFSQRSHNEWEDVFITKAEKNGYKGYVHDFEGHNLATFSTGYGDGCYATYIGFDDGGNACQILTDFGLVEWWKLKENDGSNLTPAKMN